MNPNAKLANSLPPPLLDRVLGSKLLELSKATRFAMQTVQEEAQKLGCQPKGRHLLWTVFEKLKMEKDKGVALTQNHLLNLKVPSGSDVRSLEEFRNRFDFAWHALELTERPSESAAFRDMWRWSRLEASSAQLFIHGTCIFDELSHFKRTCGGNPIPDKFMASA